MKLAVSHLFLSFDYIEESWSMKFVKTVIPITMIVMVSW